MISPIKVVTVLAATLLAVLPSVSATCVVQDISVWKGLYSTWNTTSNKLIYLESPRYDLDIINQQDDKFELTAQCNSACVNNVVLRITMETETNEFYVSVNNWYLLSTFAWTYSPNAVPGNVLYIGKATKISTANSAPTFYTGKLWYRNRNTQYGWATIYAVQFPNWLCPTVTPGQPSIQLNTIKVVNRIVNHCSGAISIKSKRSCPAGAVRGDPQFAGLRGQDYQVHGIDGGIYNLITAPALSVTSRFVWLDGPRDCPIMPSTGEKSAACWAHKGSYLDNLAIINNAGAKILIQSGPASSGLASVEIDGKSVKMGASIDFGNGREALHYNSTHEVTVVAGVFTVVIENSDGFVNLRSISVKGEDWAQLKNDDTHGLLGQTWRTTTTKKVIEGRVDDYLLESGEMFGSDFMYNRYQGAQL